MDRYAVLRVRNVRLALPVRFFDGVATKVVSVAIGWQVYQLTHDPLALGLIGLAQGLPYMAVSLWAGQIVDRSEKSRIIAWAEAGGLLSAAALALLSLAPHPPLAALYGLLAMNGLCRSFQWTAYTTYLQLAVGGELFPKAAAWNTTTWHVATIAGPALGGLIYGMSGAAAAYAAAAACFLIALGFASGLGHIEARAEPAERPDVFSGVRFVLSEQVLVAAMSLDMLGMLFGGVDGVLPMFAARLGAGPTGLGLLGAAPAVGAALCSVYLAHQQPVRRMGLALLWVITTFGACMVAFAFSRTLWLSLLILAASGAVDGISMVLRASIYYAMTPDAMRGRVSAVNGIFIRASNQLGAFESGLAARLMGLVPSVVFGGCATIVCAVFAAWKAPRLRRFVLAA